MTEKELKALRVKDVIDMPLFKEQMAVQVRIEEKTQTEAIMYGNMLRTPLDALREKGLFCAERMVELFAAVVNKSLIGFSSSERQYIYGVGMLCFGRVLQRLREQITTS